MKSIIQGFGYGPAVELEIELPDGIPSANFMARALQNDVSVLPICGAVTYAKEFGL